jgi:NAD(P)-dependent dehydrogenase (short-subunit alcohol dehydrogenase family)
MRQHANTMGIQCNFANQEDVQRLCTQLPDMQLDSLINNAYTPIENLHFHKTEPELFKTNFIHNILPLIQITQAAIVQFRKKKSGKIINITTSFLLNKPPFGLSGYVAEKAYLASLSKSWAHENAAYNITSNCIAPSMMQTAFLKNTDERVIEAATAAHPLKRLLTIDETADSVCLMIKAPSHINGATWVINGGADVI